MTELNRRALLTELDNILHRAEPHVTSKGPVSTSVAQARHEMATTLKAAIENGDYDVPGSTARAYYIDVIRARWVNLTPRQRNKLYDLDSLLKIAVQQLADPHPVVGEPTEPVVTLDTPKPRKSPWFWPLWALCGLLVVVLGGTAVSLLMGGV